MNTKTVLILLLCLLGMNAFANQVIKNSLINITPDERYSYTEGDDYVVDLLTGLHWKRCPQGLSGNNCATGEVTGHNWGSALKETVTDSNGDVWRLPNIKELRSLVAYDRHTPSISLFAFPETPAKEFWSSSPDMSGLNNTWFIDFETGLSSSAARTSEYNVRLVKE